MQNTSFLPKFMTAESINPLYNTFGSQIINGANFIFFRYAFLPRAWISTYYYTHHYLLYTIRTVWNYLLSNREHATGARAKSGNAENGKNIDTFGLFYNLVDISWIFIHCHWVICNIPITYLMLYTFPFIVSHKILKLSSIAYTILYLLKY